MAICMDWPLEMCAIGKFWFPRRKKYWHIYSVRIGMLPAMQFVMHVSKVTRSQGCHASCTMLAAPL